MSLSRWIRDYLFYPLAQSRSKRGSARSLKVKRRLKLMWAAFVTMIIFGIWHGAGWTFVVWGAYHGAVVAAYHLFTLRERNDAAEEAASPLREALTSFGGWLVTFPIVLIGFLIFRAPTLTAAVELVGRALRPFSFPGRTPMASPMVFRTLGTMAIILAVGVVAGRKNARPGAPQDEAGSFAQSHVGAIAEALVLGVMLVLALVVMTGTDATFLYFQF